MAHFGETLQDLRKGLGLSQEFCANEVSKRYDVSIGQTYWSALEKRKAPPRGEIFSAICDYFKADPSIFFSPLHGDVPTAEIRACAKLVRDLRARRAALRWASA